MNMPLKDVDKANSELDLLQKTNLNFIGRGVRFLREKNQVTQQELEWYSGVSQNQISFIESGKTNFKMDCITRIAGAFDLDLCSFIEVCRLAPH